MKRATFSAGNSFPTGRRRSIIKPAVWLFSLCSLMVSGVAIAEKLMGDGGGLGGMLSPENAAAGQLSGLLGGASEGEKKPSAVLITPSGDLSAEQRAWLLEQARKGAPIPLDGKGEATDPEALRHERLEDIAGALRQADGG